MLLWSQNRFINKKEKKEKKDDDMNTTKFTKEGLEIDEL